MNRLTLDVRWEDFLGMGLNGPTNDGRARFTRLAIRLLVIGDVEKGLVHSFRSVGDQRGGLARTGERIDLHGLSVLEIVADDRFLFRREQQFR